MNQKIKIGAAAEQYGRTTSALRAWIARWNRRNPDRPIRRHPGYVDARELRAAMDAWEHQHTPALRVAEGVSHGLAQGRA